MVEMATTKKKTEPQLLQSLQYTALRKKYEETIGKEAPNLPNYTEDEEEEMQRQVDINEACKTALARLEEHDLAGEIWELISKIDPGFANRLVPKSGMAMLKQKHDNELADAANAQSLELKKAQDQVVQLMADLKDKTNELNLLIMRLQKHGIVLPDSDDDDDEDVEMETGMEAEAEETSGGTTSSYEHISSGSQSVPGATLPTALSSSVAATSGTSPEKKIRGRPAVGQAGRQVHPAFVSGGAVPGNCMSLTAKDTALEVAEWTFNETLPVEADEYLRDLIVQGLLSKALNHPDGQRHPDYASSCVSCVIKRVKGGCQWGEDAFVGCKYCMKKKFPCCALVTGLGRFLLLPLPSEGESWTQLASIQDD